MSRRSISNRLIQHLVAVATLVLLAEPGYAHAAHQKNPTATSTVTVPVVDPLDVHEGSGVQAASDSHKNPKEAIALLSWVGRFHPMIVHFPIAYFITALVAEALFAATSRELFRHALRFLLWGGALAAVVAVALGWIFASTGTTEHGWLLDAHQWAGTATSALGLAVLWANERVERRGGSRALLRLSLSAVAALVAATGFLGGSLLYGIDHLAWSQASHVATTSHDTESTP